MLSIVIMLSTVGNCHGGVASERPEPNMPGGLLEGSIILTGVSESRHPSTPPSNKGKAGRPKGISKIIDSAKKRKRQEHNKKGNERKKKEKKDLNTRVVELEGRLASLSGWATDKIVMSSKLEAAEAAARSAEKKQEEAEELATEKGYRQAIRRERTNHEDKEALWINEKAELKRVIFELRQTRTAVSRSAEDIEHENIALRQEVFGLKEAYKDSADKYTVKNRQVHCLCFPLAHSSSLLVVLYFYSTAI
jgi:hypothetical protein